MKFLILALAIMLPLKSFAVASNAQSISILASDGTTRGSGGATAGTITKSAWRTVASAPLRAIKGAVITNTTTVPMQVAVGPSGSEVLQLIVPAGYASNGNYTGGAVPQYYELSISQGVKVAVESLNSDASSGELDINFLYY